MWKAETGTGKSHMIATLILLHKSIHFPSEVNAQIDLESSKILVLTTSPRLATRDEGAFGPLVDACCGFSDKSKQLVYTADWEKAIAMTEGLLIIDECDYILRKKRDAFKSFLSANADNPKLKVVMLSGCPFAEDNAVEHNYIDMVLGVQIMRYAPT